MKTLSFFLAATAAATYLVVSAEEASAQGRRGGGGGGSSIGRSFSSGSSIRSGGSSFRSSGGSSSRSFTQSNSGSSRSFSSRNSGGSNSGRSFVSNGNRTNNTVRSTTVQQNPSNRIVNNTNVNRTNTNVNRTNTNVNRTTTVNNTNNSVRNNTTTGNNNRVTTPNSVATNQPRPSILAPNLRSGLGVPVPKGNTGAGNSFVRSASLPVHKAVQGNTVQRARVGLPLNLAPKASFTKVAVPTHFHSKWRPFVQRHWRSAFFWVAVAGIGYVTIPEWGYERFRTYVDRDEPDYVGASTWLNECAVRDEGHEVVRVSTPPNLVVSQTVATLPDTQYDERLGRFVNRRWNSPYVWISVPRVGNVTVPQTVSEEVQKLMGGTPPDMEAALRVMEEAAASDTVVAEAPQVETPSAQ